MGLWVEPERERRDARSQVQFWAPEAAGGGVTLVMAYLNGIFIPHLLCMRTLVAKIVGTTCGILSSLAVGPEGPMVHIGAAVASVMTTPFLTGSFADELREANKREREQRPPRWFSSRMLVTMLSDLDQVSTPLLLMS